MSARHTHRVASLCALGVLGAAALTGCGSSSSSAAGSGSPSGFRVGVHGVYAPSPAMIRKIETCLKAAGVSSSLPTGRPSSPPSGAGGGPVPKPTGSTAAGAFYANSQVHAALKACGIIVPQPSGAPSGVSTPE